MQERGAASALIIPERFERIQALALKNGDHNPNETEMCVMARSLLPSLVCRTAPCSWCSACARSRSDAMNAHVHPLFRDILNAAAKVPHQFNRVGGCGLDDAIHSECSCGWKSKPVKGWRDDQSTRLSAQEVQHRMGDVQQMREGGVL